MSITVRTKNRRLQVYEEYPVDNYSSLDELRQVINQSSHLEDATFEADTKHEYGDTHITMFIGGWRPATTEEAQAHRSEQRKAKRAVAESQRRRDEEVVQQIRKRNPDLLKD